MASSELLLLAFFILNNMNYIYKKLNNGLNVILLPRRDSQVVTMYAMAGVGSDYEKKDENGVFHFLEHMSMKGSEKWPEKISLAEKYPKARLLQGQGDAYETRLEDITSQRVGKHN